MFNAAATLSGRAMKKCVFTSCASTVGRLFSAKFSLLKVETFFRSMRALLRYVVGRKSAAHCMKRRESDPAAVAFSIRVRVRTRERAAYDVPDSAN